MSELRASRTRLVGEQGTDPRRAEGRTLPQILRDRAAENPGGVFMRRKHHGRWREFTWSEVMEKVRAIAGGLTELGVGKDDVVAVISENLVEVYWIEYAALSLGARVVCLYPDVTAEEFHYIVDHSGAKAIFAEDQEQVDKTLEVLGRLEGILGIVYLDDRGLWHYENPLLQPLERLIEAGTASASAQPDAFAAAIDAAVPDDPAVLCYTSGTTGKPKGVVLNHRYLLDNAYRLMAAFGLRRGAEYLSYISPAWAAEQITGLGLGVLCPMVVNFAEKPETVQSDLRELGPEFLLFTPRQWEMMASNVQANIMDSARWRQALYDWAVKSDPARGGIRRFLAERLMLRGIRDNLGLSHTVAALSGGAGMSAEVFDLFHVFGVPLKNLYGSTELGLIASHWKSSDADTMGDLLPTDPSLSPAQEVWVDDTGELLVAAGAHFLGYWKDPEATAEFDGPDGSYRTGDAVRLREDGQLIFLDRVKDLRQLADGHRFPPQFIENHLRASPFVRDAMVLGDEKRPYVATLVNIDAQIAGRFAERNNLAFGTFTELSQLPEVRAEIGKVIERVNRLLDPPARVRAFATLPKELDPDEAELTRSRKLRRGQIEESYADIIRALYDGSERCDATILVRYQDGSSSELRAEVAINHTEDAP